jgi:hypothetical protein
MTDPVMLLSQAHGEGRVTFRALRAAGFYTLQSIAEASAHTLSDRGHLSMQTARRLKAGAEEMLEQGIGAVPPAPDPPSGLRSRTARVAGGNGLGRKSAAGDTATAVSSFSEGVSPEEGALLGQGGEPADEPIVAPRHLEIAAAAEMAAELTRVLPQPRWQTAEARRPDAPERAPAPRQHVGRTPGAFWSFG